MISYKNSSGQVDYTNKSSLGNIWYLLTDDECYILAGENEDERIILNEATSWTSRGKNISTWEYKNKS